MILCQQTTYVAHSMHNNQWIRPEHTRTGAGATKNCQIAFLAPNLLRSCRNFGLWLPELCSEVLNPETESATNLA